MTWLKVQWHCLLRTFQKGHRPCFIRRAPNPRYHFCECGYMNPDGRSFADEIWS